MPEKLYKGWYLYLHSKSDQWRWCMSSSPEANDKEIRRSFYRGLTENGKFHTLVPGRVWLTDDDLWCIFPAGEDPNEHQQ